MKTLITCETIFCDNEKDKTILNTYFDRFKYTIESMKIAIKFSSLSFDAKWFIYISEDKIEFIQKLNEITKDFKNINIVIYQHNYKLYNITENSHIDILKSPNKSIPILRNKLFKKALNLIDYISYSNYIRCCLDDDDLVNSLFFENIYKYLNFVNLNFISEVVGLALSNTNIVYVREKIKVDNVKLSKALTGNKYYYFKSLKMFYEYSPYSFPETIDREINLFSQKNNSITYSYINNSYTSLNYIRWGNNLSNQDKSELIIDYNYSYQLEYLDDFIINEESYLFDTKLKLMGKINNNCINFSINGDHYCKNGDYLAYYIYANKIPIHKTKYKLNYFFDSLEISKEYVDQEIRVKAFIKRKGKVIETVHKRLFR